MKRFFITSQMVVVGAESELYGKLLKDLGINFIVKDVDAKIEQKNVTIRQLIHEGGLAIRTANCLIAFINYNQNMHVADFVRNYSAKEFMQRRNVGSITLLDLKQTLAEFGYDW